MSTSRRKRKAPSPPEPGRAGTHPRFQPPRAAVQAVLPGRYTGPARAIHWLMAAMILVQIPAGILMLRVGQPLQDPLFILHKGLGPLIGLVLLVRIAWRLTHTPPPLREVVGPLEARVAGAVHTTLYLALLLQVITGYLRTVAGGFPIELLDALGIPPLMGKDEAIEKVALALHGIGAFALVALIAMHVTAALRHLLIDRDRVFSRMWPL